MLNKIKQRFLSYSMVIGSDSRILEVAGMLWLQVLVCLRGDHAHGDGLQNALCHHTSHCLQGRFQAGGPHHKRYGDGETGAQGFPKTALGAGEMLPGRDRKACSFRLYTLKLNVTFS